MGEDVPWSSGSREDWLRAVGTWLDEVLAPLGEQRESMDSVKERPWGAVLCVRTSARALWFKAVAPGGRHEVRLLCDIAQRSPGLAPDVLAAHEEEGWLLMPDHGRAVVEEAPAVQVDAVEALLPGYAALQRTGAAMVDGWSDAGVPDRSPSRLPDLLDRLLAGHGALGAVQIDASELGNHRRLLGALADACEHLDRGGVPKSIDHADVHGWNVLVGHGAPRLIDWGDACITHPFSSLLVPIEWVAGRLAREEQPTALDRLCDAYLGGWGEGDRDLLGFAVWVGYVARALSNDEQCAGGSAEVVRDGQREIVALLRTWAAKADRLDRPTELLLPMLEL